MSDILYPPWLRTSRTRFDFVSNTEASRSIFSGVVSSVARAGDRVRARLSTENASDRASSAERAILKALYGNLRGQANRLWIADPSYTPRGSFPYQEALTNNTFASGTTSWTSGTWTLSVADRLMRCTRNKNVGATATVITPSSAAAVTQYAPYAARVFFTAGLGTSHTYNLGDGISGANWQSNIEPGMIVGKQVSLGTTLQPYLSDYAFSGRRAGDYIDVAWMSMTRCLLVDNQPNQFLYSDELDNAAWTKTRCSVSANDAIAPHGSTTADAIIEDSTASNTHGISRAETVSSAALDFCISICLKAGTRTWARVGLTESTSSHEAAIYVNLSTGATGSTTLGANWANQRYFVTDLGNGWYRVHLIATKLSAATSVTGTVRLATGDSGQTYSGDGASKIYAWRDGFAQSSVPFLPAQTTSAATTGTSQTGSNLYVKGLPASTNGLLLPGDWVQIGTDLNMVVAPLNSDAAGLGYLQLYRPPRSAPADNDPVIVNSPMGRFIATSNEGGWDDSPGLFSNFEREFEEALDL